MSYPVLEILKELTEALENNATVILQAPPGAGKSTILPLRLKELPFLSGKKIIMLEPRRLAAKSIAQRMSSLLAEEVGHSVGYRVRFDTCVSENTCLEVVTDGILIRMLQQDNTLEDVSLVVFDEFHERSLSADLALALTLQLQQVLRPDLKLLIMSATLDTETLSASLGKVPVIRSEGRQYPVELSYLGERDQNIANNTAHAIRSSLRRNDGDLLVFLPGAGEISRVASILGEEEIPAEVYSLYGDLPYKKQQEAILPHPLGKRKIVLATSIAETSLTIEGIKIVIDSGYARVPRYDPRSGFTRLETIRVSKDAADQRAGRAGRLGPGICFRLWTQTVQTNLIANRVPEILEADLAPLLLELKEWGVKDVNELTWITMPPAGAISQASELLHDIEALREGVITRKGRSMLKLPTHPRIAHMLLEAIESDDNMIISTAIAIASLLEERDPLPRGKGADLSLRVEIFNRWIQGERVDADTSSLEKIRKLSDAWARLLKVKYNTSHVLDTVIGKLILSVYPERLAKQTEAFSPRFKLANGRTARLPEHDPLMKERWLAVAHLDAGQGEGKIFTAAPVSEDDLIPMSERRETVRWDDEREQVVGREERFIGSLTITSKPLAFIDDQLRIKALCDVVAKSGLKFLGWEESHQLWQARVLSLRHWRPNDSWPDVREEALLSSTENWLAPFLGQSRKASELQKMDLYAILQSILSWEQQRQLDALAPSRIEVPSGSMIRLQYFNDGRPPVMEVRLQEVFGLADTPTVNEGKMKTILHLLSPGYKPVQVTQDLKSFWNNTYAEVRKELRTRYPRHSWPDDPWTAQAVRGAKRRS